MPSTQGLVDAGGVLDILASEDITQQLRRPVWGSVRNVEEKVDQWTKQNVTAQFLTEYKAEHDRLVKAAEKRARQSG